MKIYAKNSFDRFGDDLTEAILKYLKFEDKIRLECVSKQWRRFIYNKQFVIIITDFNFNSKNSLNKVLGKTGTDHRRQLNEQQLESVLKKCPNVIEVDLCLTVNSSVLSLICQYCPRIKSLSYQCSIDDKSLDFFRINGHKLEDLILRDDDNELEFGDNTEKDNKMLNSILKLCPNLKSIWFPLESNPLFKDKEILPKLKEINLTISSQNVKQMKILSDKYSKTMKTLKVMLCDLTTKKLKTCIECIARFENLKELTLGICSISPNQQIDCLSLIGQKCNKLLKLQFSDICLTTKSDLFKAITQFKAIKVLKISLEKNTLLSETVECFKHCKQLKHLVIDYPELTEDFFANIETFIPKLTLRIQTEQQFSDSFIDAFHSMKNIQKVTINLRYEYKTWYFGKSLSEVMLSPNGMNVKHITHNCGLIIKRREVNIKQ